MRVADFGGTARFGTTYFSTDSFGYVGLGYQPDTLTGIPDYPTDFWQYNPYTNIWIQKDSFPGQGRVDAVCFALGSKAYYGTGENNTYQGLNDFWEYDVSTNTWSQKGNFGGGYRYNCIGFSIGAKGYVGLGYTDTATAVQGSKDMWEYDSAVDTWTRLNDFPGSSIEDVFLFSVNGQAYVGLGHDSITLAELNDFWRYDPASDTWTQLADLPGQTIDGGFYFNIGNKGYLNANYDSIPNDYNAPGYSSHFYEYNIASDAWTQKDSFPDGMRTGLASFVINNKAYVGTGSSYYLLNCVTDFWMYTPVSIFPDPASDKLYINTSLTNFSISIADMTGQSWPFFLSGSEIDVSALPAGVYCLRIQDSSGSVVRKFVKE